VHLQYLKTYLTKQHICVKMLQKGDDCKGNMTILKVACHKGAVSQSTMFECYKLSKNGSESLTDNQCSSCLYTTLAKVSSVWDQHAKILNKWQQLAYVTQVSYHSFKDSICKLWLK